MPSSRASASLGFMQGGAVPLAGPPAVDQPLGLYRRGRVRDFGPGRRRRALADALVADERVKPIGLGARDSLRLEGGLAALRPRSRPSRRRRSWPASTFAINKRRRAEGGFAGAMRILAELENGPPQKRVGFDVDGRQPVREGALVLDGEGNEVGRVTSGGFSPSLQRPIAMGYVATPSRRGRHRAEARAARQAVRRARRRRCRSSPTAITAREPPA